MCRNKEISNVDDPGENGIKDLRDRFVNLMTESKKLKKRKQEINEETEAVRKMEKERLTQLTKQLYERQQTMRELQKQLTDLTVENTELERGFETEINQKNSR